MCASSEEEIKLHNIYAALRYAKFIHGMLHHLALGRPVFISRTQHILLFEAFDLPVILK